MKEIKEENEKALENEDDLSSYCQESDEEVTAEKRPSIEDEIEKLTSEIKVHEDIELDLTTPNSRTNLSDRTDIIIGQLRDISQYICTKCTLIDKMSILMCILSYKIFELENHYKKKLEGLGEERENILLKKDDEDMVAVELLDLDRIIREVTFCHYQESQNFIQEKIDLQKQYENLTAKLDNYLEIMRKNLSTLKTELRKLTSEVSVDAQPILIEYIMQDSIEEYTVKIDEFSERQKRGWKTLYGDEKILDELHERGLVVTKSGHILNQAGEKLTYDQAEKRKLLDGLDFRDRIPKREVEFKNEDLFPSPPSSPTTVAETEKDSLTGEIGSEDVSYLKEALGKPLTLALAEITAKQPRDPIHYLGHWLFKYRYNQELDITQKEEYNALMAERNRLLREKLHRLYEEEARLVIFEMINSAENEAIKKELERILREQMMGENEEHNEADFEYDELRKLMKLIKQQQQQQQNI